jgi:iron complex outermembrane receptor protein
LDAKRGSDEGIGLTRQLQATAVSALALGFATSAWAQASAPPAPASPATPSAGALSEVVVTAQRREQSVQDVGIAISVLTGQQLALRGVKTVTDLQYQTPGLEITPQFGSGQPGFRLRGVGFDDYASNNSSPVGVYIDEVAYPFPVQTTGQIFDLSRVEVLRGPQGTLYGRNTTGGAINFITNRPTSSYSAGFDADVGTYGYSRAEAFVSGPITDTLLFRISGVTEHGGGFQHNRDTGEEIGDLDRSTGRAQLEWKPTSRLDVRVEGDYGYDHSDGQGLYRFDNVGGAPADRNPYETGWGASPAFAQLIGIQTDTKPFKHNQNGGIDLHVDYDFGFAKFTNITGYHILDRREYEDWDATSAADADEFFDTHAKVFSDEARLSSQGHGPLKWVAGLYFSKEDLRDTFLSDFVDYPGLGLIADTAYAQHAHTIAGFGQVDYRITERLSVTGGLRLEYERRSLDNFSTTVPNGPVFATLASENIDYTRLSGKAEADYRLTHATLLYASASHGVKSGGFTAVNTTNPNQLAPFKPESLWAYEAGVKSQFFDNTLRFNGDGFYYDYRDEQVQGAVFDSFSGGPIGKIVNAPKSHIWGLEGEVQWKPHPQLEITQSVSLKRGEFDDYQGLDVALSTAAKAPIYDNRDGEDLGFPKWSLNGSATWTQPIGGDYRLVAEADYSYRDKYVPVLLGAAYNVSDYWLANATLTFSPNDGPWSLGLWGRNITGTRYDYTRNFFLPGVDIAAPGAPATFGARVSYRYN